MEPVPPPSWNNSHQPREKPLSFNERAGIKIKSASELKKLSPIEQVEQLSIMEEAAFADAGYAVVAGQELIEEILQDNSLPPITHILAQKIEPIMRQDFSEADRGPYAYNPAEQEKSFGYSNIVTPEMIPYSSSDIKNMSEEEMKTELASLEKEYPEGSYQRTLDLELALNKIYYSKNQAKLHLEFPHLPQDKTLVKIAPDTVATVEFDEKYDPDESWFSFSPRIDSISDKKGHTTDDKSLPISDTDFFYLKTIHEDNSTKAFFNKILNVSLDEISLSSQVQLLKFMAKANNTRFDTLCNTMQKLDSDNLRKKLLENFVATDFGEDFGDSLLTIASSERLNDNEKEQILNEISSCRESVQKITELYSDIDNGKFAEEYTKASSERLTDVITVFEQIATNGTAEADLDWAGHPEFTFESAMEALEYETKSLDIISGTLEDVQNGKNGAFAEMVLHPDPSSQRLNRTVYNFYSPNHGYVLLYTRPEGSHSFDPMTEYGKTRSRYNENTANVGVEASISFVTNPIAPFSLPSPFKPDQKAIRDPHFYDPSTMNKVSAIRLDREGRAPGAPADDPSRDPVNPIGTVSVDLAAIGDRADTPSGKIARLLSTGNKLRKSKIADANFSLNHNTKWFDQEQYGTANGFRQIVDFIDKMATNWCTEHQPSKESNSFTELMRQQKRAERHRVA
ncbi:hypothetical protein IJI91_01750 [Candidatus Saccharibacteria bacterium]|nr:hypothetical protein [Candidatus Saccharibacteria bacterium]